jgi:predicted TIM-barrel fold metal-dependent hydrolase
VEKLKEKFQGLKNMNDWIENISLIDVHVHVGFSSRNWWVGDELLKMQRDERLDYILCMADLGLKEKLIRLAKENPDQIGILPYFNSTDQEELKTVESMLRDYPELVKGLKIHPAGYKYQVSLETVGEVFRLANEYDVMVQTHTGAENNEAAMFLPVMEKYPDTKLILHHAFPIQDACRVAESFENVFVDTSYTVDNREAQLYMLNRLGKEKILYAIDGIQWFPKGEQGEYIPQFRSRAKEMLPWYKNDRDAVEHICYKNAAKLLNLKVG